MKNIALRIIFFLLTFQSIGQIYNPNFELWVPYLGDTEIAEGWYCPWVTSELFPCDKIIESQNDFALRLHNIMPCGTIDGQKKFRSSGFTNTHFIPMSQEFEISYDLKIDSIEYPANFAIILKGIKSGEPKDSILEWNYYDLIEERIKHEIFLTKEYDSLFLEFRSIGILKENPIHECDKGYISSIIDCIVLDQIVRIKSPQEVKLKVFPNPATNEFSILSSTPIKSVILFDLTGRKILYFDQLDSKEFQVNLKNLESQIYILKILTSEGIIIQKILKK
jgi:hypothetical protein